MAVTDKRSRLLKKAARRSEQEAYELKREARNSCGRGRKAVYRRGKKVGCRTKRRR